MNAGAGARPNRLTAPPGGLVARTIGKGLSEVASPTRHAFQARAVLPGPAGFCLGCAQPGTLEADNRDPPPPTRIWRRDIDRQVVSDDEGDLWILTRTPASDIAFAEITAAQLHAAFA